MKVGEFLRTCLNKPRKHFVKADAWNVHVGFPFLATLHAMSA
jgi:hypothetical protein